MKRTLISIFCSVIMAFACSLSMPQYPDGTVGLVLSGGGAKGVAHIGLIQALEENNIPIDFITGTSIGAIIGSLYAIGYTPAQMLELLGSEDFKMWQSGKIRESWTDYYKELPPTPRAIGMKLVITDSLRIRRQILPRYSLVDPSAMKFGMFEVYGLNSVSCHESFDSLFVPFRAVASDICNNSPKVFKTGNLGKSVRASMAFPFVFQPVNVDGNLYYDGGIYNNFPKDIMIDEFHPQFIIGSAVTENPLCPEEGDLIGQIESMIMQYTDYEIDDSTGVKVRVLLDNIGLLDFHKASEVYAAGYDAGLYYVDSILNKLHRRVDLDSLNRRRFIYRQTHRMMAVDSLVVEGVNDNQKRYIMRHFTGLTLPKLREGFYSLASDPKIDNIDIELSPTNCNEYDAQRADSLELMMRLYVKMNRNIDVRLGGLLTEGNTSRFYGGIGYKSIQRVATDINLDLQLGKMYCAGSLGVRTEMPIKVPLVNMLQLKYLRMAWEDKSLLLRNGADAYKDLLCEQFFGQWGVGAPVGKRGKLELHTAFGRWSNEYKQANHRTRSSFDVLKIETSFNYDKMKDPFYAYSGYKWGATVSLHKSARLKWWQASAAWQKYFAFNRVCNLGLSAAGLWSDFPNLKSPMMTSMFCPGYTPFGYEYLRYNEYLHARRWVSAGLHPVLRPWSKFQIRADSYWFQPIQYSSGGHFGWRGYFMLEPSLVFQTSVGDVVGFVHIDRFEKWNFHWGIRVGYLINDASL